MVKITILGNNSALPAFGRHPTAQIIEIREQLFLMDCGEGTQAQMGKFGIRPGHINHIFISHLHGDHYFGLIGLLSSMGLWNREKEIHLYGPEPLMQIIQIQLDAINSLLPYPLIFHPIPKIYAGILLETTHYSVSCFPVSHRIPCHGFRFTEKSAGRRINPEACQQYNIPLSYYSKLKEGADFLTEDNKLIKNEILTLSAPPDKVYAFCADTRYEPAIIPYIKNADLIYHESTFLKENEEKAFSRYHSTAQQAAQLAKQAGVKKLLLGHYSSRYEEIEVFEQEAHGIFPNTEASREGANYEIK